jgi:hypothetical protein
MISTPLSASPEYKVAVQFLRDALPPERAESFRRLLHADVPFEALLRAARTVRSLILDNGISVGTARVHETSSVWISLLEHAVRGHTASEMARDEHRA